ARGVFPSPSVNVAVQLVGAKRWSTMKLNAQSEPGHRQPPAFPDATGTRAPSISRQAVSQLIHILVETDMLRKIGCCSCALGFAADAIDQ
ncbi:hypothetical protein, partial [Mesorhizobium sp.]|uniref:hypothetical protein n=1 Tax=Mesorhizobium sp. TaxID=1871066 RepID=UPI0025C4D9A9